MRRFVWLLGTLPFLFVASIHAEEDAKPAWLFVLTGEVESASATEIVIKAHPTVVAFTDRPNRLVKAMSVESFVDDLWKSGADSFEKDPPNAALVFGDEQLGIDELKSVKRSGGTVSFSTEDLSGGLPEAGDQVAVVIDIF